MGLLLESTSGSMKAARANSAKIYHKVSKSSRFHRRYNWSQLLFNRKINGRLLGFAWSTVFKFLSKWRANYYIARKKSRHGAGKKTLTRERFSRIVKKAFLHHRHSLRVCTSVLEEVRLLDDE